MKNLLSNDTKISFLQIFSRFNLISTALITDYTSECSDHISVVVDLGGTRRARAPLPETSKNTEESM